MAQRVPNVETHGRRPRNPELDPRVERTRERALRTALELFREGGWDAVTHLAVSERSGIGRTTLYRHWPDAASLLREVVVVGSGSDRCTVTGELRTDLLAALDQLRRNLLDPVAERAMLTVMERAAVDPSYAELRVAITRECSRPLTAIVTAAASDGRLRGVLDPEEALAALAGPLVFRRFFCRDDLPRAFLERVVDGFVAAHGARPAARP